MQKFQIIGTSWSSVSSLYDVSPRTRVLIVLFFGDSAHIRVWHHRYRVLGYGYACMGVCSCIRNRDAVCHSCKNFANHLSLSAFGLYAFTDRHGPGHYQPAGWLKVDIPAVTHPLYLTYSSYSVITELIVGYLLPGKPLAVRPSYLELFNVTQYALYR